MVPNVGANGIRPHDIIEVIRFIYLSPRENNPVFVYINDVNEPCNLDDILEGVPEVAAGYTIRPYIMYDANIILPIKVGVTVC
jgi:hypothetical protein